MSTQTIPDHYPETWDTNWYPALQTSDARLLDTVDMDDAGGDRKSYNIGGTIVYKQKTARYAETTYVAYETGKSWLTPTAWDAPVIFDEFDDAFLDSIVKPTSRVLADQAAAYARLRDSFIRDAIKSNRVTGKAGDVTETFPTANEIANGGSGLTWAKIVEATELMDTLRVPIQDRFFAIAAPQKSDLMSLAQATDRDYANTNLIKGGQIHGTEWAGFNWRQYEDLSYDSGNPTHRECLAYYKRDIILAESGMQTYMDVLPERSHALQLRPSVRIGSCRINNSALIINCVES